MSSLGFGKSESPCRGGCRERFFQSRGALERFYFAGFLYFLELTSLVGHHWLCCFTETKVSSGKEVWNVVSPGNSSIQGHRGEEGREAPTPSDEHSSDGTRGRMEHSWSIPYSIGSKRTTTSKNATKIGLGWGLATKEGNEEVPQLWLPVPAPVGQAGAA